MMNDNDSVPLTFDDINNNVARTGFETSTSTEPLGGSITSGTISSSPPIQQGFGPLPQDYNQQQQQQQQQKYWFLACRHPVAAFFHVFFKILALLVYLIASWFANFVFVFVICIILLAFDFWTVKNVTGRLLVGLRWSNVVKEDGTNEWTFESKEDTASIDPNDARVFWITLYLHPLIWMLLSLTAFFGWHFEWLLIVAVALVLGGANVILYTKCKKDARKNITSFLRTSAFQMAASSVV